jgi:hypothetical protein
MNHVSEEQLMLFFYRDQCDVAAIEKHLADCGECRAEFARVSAVLARIEATPVPEPAQDYESRVWRAIEGKLPEKRSRWAWFAPQRQWGMAAAAAVIVVVAFLAGRFSTNRTPTPTGGEVAVAGHRDRILLVGIGNHLEKSQMLLVEIMNAEDGSRLDLSNEQGQARDLLETNRLLRVSTAKNGDRETAQVLDELERLLVEVANGPSELSEEQLQQIQQRIQSQGLLFKVRVVGSKVRRSGNKVGNAGNVKQKEL